MNTPLRNTLKKSERLYSKVAIDRLFLGESWSVAAFPIRAVFRLDDFFETDKEAQAAIMISVPKRHLHHAVDRNRVKRQIREFYRKNKTFLWQAIENKNKKLSIAFIWLDGKLWSSSDVEKKLSVLFHRMEEKIQKEFNEK